MSWAAFTRTRRPAGRSSTGFTTAARITANAWSLTVPLTDAVRRLVPRADDPEAWDGAVFALDGILIGASDGAYLALSMVVAFGVFTAALAVVAWADWGVRGVWAALVVLIVTRLVLMGARFLRRRWLVTGFA